jgi:hypothetical protein
MMSVAKLAAKIEAIRLAFDAADWDEIGRILYVEPEQELESRVGKGRPSPWPWLIDVGASWVMDGVGIASARSMASRAARRLGTAYRVRDSDGVAIVERVA